MQEFNEIKLQEEEWDFLKKVSEKENLVLTTKEVRLHKSLKENGLIILYRHGDIYTFTITSRGRAYLNFKQKEKRKKIRIFIGGLAAGVLVNIMGEFFIWLGNIIFNILRNLW